eukprot:2092640-Ditylum_brightwellii.AAC.1
MPSPNANSVLIKSDPQVIQYNIHDPAHHTNNTEEDEEENEDQSVTDHVDEDTVYEDLYEDKDDALQDQNLDSPPYQPSGMNINLPFPIINTMEQFDSFQV